MLLAMGCSQKQAKTDDFDIGKSQHPEKTVKREKASVRVDLVSKGVGPVESITLKQSIDEDMVTTGKSIFGQKCTICHKVGENFIGPAPNGILERRTPEWIMNMILNPQGMIRNDPLASDLFLEFNGSPMANQGLSQDEARAILEYFRTLN